ncbi:hypothetical protein T484DRAFT_1773430 [Baffinella frigidus]|nr:hypothetical protein T484DRAFT_1773430 [Cryptophyta sp. CCMP2293]
MGGGVLMRGREFTLPVRGTCAYPHMSQNVNNLYYKKIRAPPPSMIVRKQYVMSREMFEFGPLLVGKDKEDYKTKYEENREKFRITNNGHFDMHLDFCFRNDTDGSVFVVEPEELDLAVDQTMDVTVFAFTEQEGEFKDQLVCNIRDNPEPVSIPLSCIGSSPTIITDIEPPMDDEGNMIEGAPLKLEFQRLLLKRKDVREVKLTNPSLLPTKWHLSGAGEEEEFNTGKEFSIYPTEGLLQPKQSEILTIGFKAMEKNTFEKPMEVHWVDEAELLPEDKRKNMSILLTAEAYEIDFTFKFSETSEYDGLDFRTVKVVDGRPPQENEAGELEVKEVTQQSLRIVNNGKYKVGYRFAFARPKKSIAARYFDVQTVGADGKTVDEEGKANGPSGELEPESEAEMRVFFNGYDQTGAEEVDFKDNTELRCHVSELLTKEDIFITPISINVKSVFSKYRILPQKGVAFGALTYDTSRTRNFDIVNQGEFEFAFTIVCITKAMRSR